MIQGFLLEKPENTPIVQIRIDWKHQVLQPVFIIDTGFSGCLKISHVMAGELGLVSFGSEEITIANGATVRQEVAWLGVEMEGIKHTVPVLIDDGAFLAGMGLFAKFGYRIMIDCKNKTVELHRAG